MALNRAIAPEFKTPSTVEITQPKASHLTNGIPFYLLKSGETPVIRIEFIFKAGNYYESQAGLSLFTSKMLREGSQNFTGSELEEKIAFYGGFLEVNQGMDRVTVAVYILSKHLTNVLPVLIELITKPAFPEKEFLNLKNITKQNLKINLQKTSYLASAGFKESLFGKEHPYGRTLTEEAIDSIDLAKISSYYNNYFNSKNCIILVCGSGSEDFHKIFNDSFGQLSWGKNHDAVVTNNSSQYYGERKIEKENTVQASIRLGRMMFALQHPDYYKANLLIEILGGYFGSRLMKNIREDKGLTYGISASLVNLEHAGYFAIGTDVKKEFTEQTLEEIHKEINLLKTELVGEEELTTVKNYLLGSFLNSLTTPFALGDKFKTICFNNLNYSFYDNYLESMKTITASELQETANKYFTDSSFTEVVAG